MRGTGEQQTGYLKEHTTQLSVAGQWGCFIIYVVIVVASLLYIRGHPFKRYLFAQLAGVMHKCIILTPAQIDSNLGCLALCC